MHTYTIVLLLMMSCELVLPAVVLPRPPSSSSSSNFIPRDEFMAETQDKSYHGKALYQQNTNVEKPDTQDYRFLEIDLNDAENIETLDLHDLVQAVLVNQPNPRRLDIDMDESSESNLTHPHPEVVPHSILGVRDVGLGLSQRLFEPDRQQHFIRGPSQPTKNIGDEKMYYLKSSRPKVYVNFRGRTGNFRQDVSDSKVTMRFEPAAFLRATQPYRMEKKTKAPKFPPKKYDKLIHGDANKIYDSTSTSSTTTTENTMVTSSELPKQIPAPPSRIPSRSPIVHTTPVQRFRRTDILPGYAFAEA